MRSRFSVSFVLTAWSAAMLFSSFSIQQLRFTQGSALNPLLVIGPLEDAVYVHTGRVYLVRIDLTRVNQVLDFRDRHSCRCRHHGIEVLRRFAIDEIAPAIALP